jgi:hypothetical protein
VASIGAAASSGEGASNRAAASTVAVEFDGAAASKGANLVPCGVNAPQYYKSKASVLYILVEPVLTIFRINYRRKILFKLNNKTHLFSSLNVILQPKSSHVTHNRYISSEIKILAQTELEYNFI